MAEKQKILLTTTIGPMEEMFFNSSPADVMNQRFSRGCGIFTLHGHLHMSFGHVIAQNIETPSVFLEYPSRQTFIEELKKGYDYVGIGSFNNQNGVALDMLRLVRERAPNSKTVVGGYGALGIKHLVSEAARTELIDHLCEGDGVVFFRRLLGEDENAPTKMTHLPKWGYSLPWLHRHPKGNVPVVVPSVGCPNGCDFCASTPMFGPKVRRLMTVDQIYGEFRRAWKRNPHTAQMVMLDDNGVDDKEAIRALGKKLREDEEFGLGRYNFFTLASIDSLSKWDLDELALCGLSFVFIGVESKFAPANGYKKANGDAAQLFRELHKRGIATVGAWMAGFDFQTPENIQEDLDAFIELEPTFQQLTRVCAFPGTTMWKRLRAEGRLPDEIPWNEISFYFGGGLKHPRFTDTALHRLIENGYRQMYETWGANIARVYKVHQKGYEYFNDRRGDKFCADRSRLHRAMCQQLYPMLPALEIYAPNGMVRKRMKDLQRRHEELFGPPHSMQKILGSAIRWRAAIERMKDSIHPRENVVKHEPQKVYDYTIERAPEKCPYKLSYPVRPLGYRFSTAFNYALWGGLCAAAPALRTWDRLQGIEPGPEPARENPLVYGS